MEQNIYIEAYTKKLQQLFYQYTRSENKEEVRNEIDYVVDHFFKIGSKFPLEREIYITNDGGLFQELFGKPGIKVSK